MKFPATTHGYSMAKIAHLHDAYRLRSFLTGSKPRRGPITAARGQGKEKKERRKNKQNFDFSTCPSKNVAKATLLERKYDAFFPSKFNLLVIFTYNPSFFKFSTPYIQPWHSFFNFNLDSLSSAFVLF